MKIILLTLALACGTAARSQQTDFFNADQYLKQKNKAHPLPELPRLPAPLSNAPLNNGVYRGSVPVQTNRYLLPDGTAVWYGNGTMPCIKPLTNLSKAGPVLPATNPNGGCFPIKHG